MRVKVWTAAIGPAAMGVLMLALRWVWWGIAIEFGAAALFIVLDRALARRHRRRRARRVTPA